MFYANNICPMQKSSIERQADRQQRQLAKSQIILQTKILNTKFQDQSDLFAEDLNQSEDNDLYEIKNTLIEDVYHARHH